MEKVLEKSGTTESTTLAIKREVGGKNLSPVNVLGKPQGDLGGEVLEVCNVDGSNQIARKTKKHDDWNSAISDYDPCAPAPTQPTK